jgi:hypothetical protein
MSDAVTFICFIKDHSGSMERKIEVSIENFNEQRAKLLKEDDDTIDNLVTIVEFDDTIHCNVDNMPVAKLNKLDSWWTGGMTALYDAIGFGINNIQKKMDADKRTNKAALFIVQTDGGENSSSDYEGEDGRIAINKKINELEETGLYSFVFLGEKIDKEVAQGMGFKMANIMNYDANNNSRKYASAVTSDGLETYMCARKRGATQSMNFVASSVDKLKGENDNNS